MEEYRGCDIHHNQYGYFTFPRNTNSGYLHSDGVYREKTSNESHEYTGYFKTVEDVRKAIDKYYELRENSQKENKGKTMNKREAIKAMCDGKKVFNPSTMEETKFLRMNANGMIVDDENAFADLNEYKYEGWEIYNEYNLSVEEAFKAVLDGKKVQHEDWDQTNYVYIDSEGAITFNKFYNPFVMWGVPRYKTGWKIVE